MAKGGSGLGTIIGLGAAGLGVWWAAANNWFGLLGTTTGATTTSTAAIPTTTAPTSVTLVSTVVPTSNNALQASFNIGGTVAVIAVIPGGDAYNTSGVDITANLAAVGVTPAQLYALMQAAYATQTTAAPAATNTTTGTTPAGANPVFARANSLGAGSLAAHAAAAAAAPAGHRALGMAGPMVFANRGNYVPRGSRYR